MVTKDKKIKLSNDQQKAMDRFDTFVEGDTSVFILKGYARTGNFYLVNDFYIM